MSVPDKFYSRRDKVQRPFNFWKQRDLNSHAVCRWKWTKHDTFLIKFSTNEHYNIDYASFRHDGCKCESWFIMRPQKILLTMPESRQADILQKEYPDDSFQKYTIQYQVGIANCRIWSLIHCGISNASRNRIFNDTDAFWNINKNMLSWKLQENHSQRVEAVSLLLYGFNMLLFWVEGKILKRTEAYKQP